MDAIHREKGLEMSHDKLVEGKSSVPSDYPNAHDLRALKV